MSETIRKNEKCFIGMPSCGYGYESAKSCFIACPSDDKYTLKIDVIKDIIASKQYECHIALRRIDPGNFAFCTKICSKIIQSQFCLVFLDSSTNAKGKKVSEFPNPNVHFEYGLMLGQHKYIIPLQDEKYTLAFNISPLDTIKYNETNFKSKVSEAVNNAIKMFSDRNMAGQLKQGPEIFTFYNLFGYKLSDIKEAFHQLLYQHGGHLNFYLFENNDKFKFVGPFDSEDPKKAILHTKLLIDNIIATYKNLVAIKPEDAKNGVYEYFKNKVSIDIIISPFFDKKDILNKIMSIADNAYQYEVTLYYRDDFRKRVEDEYNRIGEIKVLESLGH